MEYTSQKSKNIGLHFLTLAFVESIYNDNNRLIRLLRNLLQRFENQLLELYLKCFRWDRWVVSDDLIDNFTDIRDGEGEPE